MEASNAKSGLERLCYEMHKHITIRVAVRVAAYAALVDQLDKLFKFRHQLVFVLIVLPVL